MNVKFRFLFYVEEQEKQKIREKKHLDLTALSSLCHIIIFLKVKAQGFDPLDIILGTANNPAKQKTLSCVCHPISVIIFNV